MQPLWALFKTRRNLYAVMAGIALVGCIGFLIGVSYVSRIELQQSSIQRLRGDLEKRAAAVSYFYLERKNDLLNLASDREVSAFFENRALGMSMQYELRSSLFAIEAVVKLTVRNVC